MAIGYHPDLVDGALIGALVIRQITPAVGDEFITTTGEDANRSPISLASPNPDYVAPRDVTLEIVRTVVETANVEVFDCFESGNAPSGQMRVAFQIRVGDAGEVQRRDTIDAALVAFAPLP